MRVAAGSARCQAIRLDLYFGLLDAVDTPQAHGACFATLCSAEKRRAERFAFDRHRRQYIFAHGLLRLALSSFAPRSSLRIGALWPTIMVGPSSQLPRSHRRSISAFHIRRVASPVSSLVVRLSVLTWRKFTSGSSLFETAWSNFSPEEVDALRALDAGETSVDRFFDYWTLKEAYLKARGIGINLPLDQFSILISPNQKIGIKFTPGIADDPQRWHFMKSSPSARHRFAIADGSGLADGLPIVVQPWPLPSNAVPNPLML